MTDTPFRVAAVLLAGGQARRMGGGDKSLRLLGGKTILSHILDRILPQAEMVLLNANGDTGRFADLGLPVARDVVEGFAGPLAGILTGLEWMRANRPEISHIVSCPTDAPFIPGDLVARLVAAVTAAGADIGCAQSGDRTHPVIGLWPVALAGALREALTVRDIRKIDRWTAEYSVVYADWPAGPVDPFFNVNRPDDLALAEELLSGTR
ncbi:MAG: molybdenum cofactor guanylyltransferase MobA [Rhodospirillales bacterium]